MKVLPQEIASKTKIGTLKGKPVFEIALRGGYHIVCTPNGSKVDYLGVGPHRAVARFIAKKTAPDIVINQLAKADYVSPEYFQHLVPQYETFTLLLNTAASAC